MMQLIHDSYRYRELIWALAIKELKIRYKRSVLGFMWALLNPAFMMLVLTLVFSTIMFFLACGCWLFINPRKVIVYSDADREHLEAQGVLA